MGPSCQAKKITFSLSLFWDWADISICSRKPLEFGSMSWLNGCKRSVLTLTVNAKDTGASASPARWWGAMMGGDDGGIILNEVRVREKNTAKARIFLQARSQMKQEAFSSLYTNLFPLWSVSLQGSGSNYRVSNKTSEKKKTLPVISVTEDTDGSVKTVCRDTFYCFRVCHCYLFSVVCDCMWGVWGGGGGWPGDQLLMGFPVF